MVAARPGVDVGPHVVDRVDREARILAHIAGEGCLALALLERSDGLVAGVSVGSGRDFEDEKDFGVVCLRAIGDAVGIGVVAVSIGRGRAGKAVANLEVRRRSAALAATDGYGQRDSREGREDRAQFTPQVDTVAPIPWRSVSQHGTPAASTMGRPEGLPC